MQKLPFVLVRTDPKKGTFHVRRWLTAWENMSEEERNKTFGLEGAFARLHATWVLRDEEEEIYPIVELGKCETRVLESLYSIVDQAILAEEGQNPDLQVALT